MRLELSASDSSGVDSSGVGVEVIPTIGSRPAIRASGIEKPIKCKIFTMQSIACLCSLSRSATAAAAPP